MKRTTREWVRKAEADFRGAQRLATGDEPFHDLVTFHCQQCAEKYLKTLLEELGQHIPKTHALDDLLSRLLPHHAPLASLRRGLLFLTDFAVDPRNRHEQTGSCLGPALGRQAPRRLPHAARA
jgi:HEPN domain-containing protein